MQARCHAAASQTGPKNCDQMQESLAVMILLAEGVEEPDIPRKLDQLWTTFCLSELSLDGADTCDELLGSWYASETDTVPEVAIKAARNRQDDPGEFEAAVPSLKSLFQAAVTNALHSVVSNDRQVVPPSMLYRRLQLQLLHARAPVLNHAANRARAAALM